ncbi:transcriptional regulator protein [Rhizobium sp. NXC14]|uniref:helix-turn-helix domain-containing protein n=1 Tax=Rhizobium sp. NXC14 TaxID=1981173 RepID=UPI000A201611|nr:helix-turn-helix domain-containing protein [Rhizobium sp. NXC14]ARO31716.1 transcriptional regulator protein [Rhizobium sp. NXC14]
MSSKSRPKQYSHKDIHRALLTFNKVFNERFGIPLPHGLRTVSGEVRETLLSASHAAEYLGVSQKTLANWRCSGTRGLPYVQVGGRVLYRQSDLDDFIMNSRKLSTSERDWGRHG